MGVWTPIAGVWARDRGCVGPGSRVCTGAGECAGRRSPLAIAFAARRRVRRSPSRSPLAVAFAFPLPLLVDAAANRSMIPAVAPHLTHARLLLALLALPLALSLWVYLTMVRMPGASYAGPFEPLTPSERALEAALRRDVAMLAGHTPAADHLDAALVEAGYVVSRRRFDLEAERRGTDPGIVLVGARYDTAPGAADDLSGVAALLSATRAPSTSPMLRWPASCPA